MFVEEDRAGDLGQAPAVDQAGDPAPRSGTLRSLGTSFITSLMVQGSGLITGIVLARSLGATHRGELAAAILWPSVFAALSTLGLQDAATYHVARGRETAGSVIGSGLVLVALQSLAFTAACGGVLPLVLGHDSSTTLGAAFLYLLYIPLNAIGTLMVGVLNGSRHYKAFNALRLAIGLTVLIAQAILLAIDDLTVWTMVIGYTLCGVVCALYAFVLVARTRPGRLHADRRVVRELFRYGIRSHASTTSSQFNQRLDQMLISIFLPVRQLGLYVAATTLSSLTGTIGLTVAFVALPEVARLDAGPERTLLARRLVSMTLLASAVVAVPAVILAPILVKLFFGGTFGAAVAVTRILGIATICYSTTRSIEAVLRALGKPLDAGIAEFIALGITAISLAALIPIAGIFGAGLSSLLAYGMAGFWMARKAAAALETSWYELILPDRGCIELIRTVVRPSRPSRST